ncbi:hypothetical protein AN958_00064 [Leucoagaricus sp. SymC.cos]|nr:hypothetical protein AN958_00064 [Leucoagaricus sp. SymC.cos]
MPNFNVVPPAMRIHDVGTPERAEGGSSAVIISVFCKPYESKYENLSELTRYVAPAPLLLLKQNGQYLTCTKP